MIHVAAFPKCYMEELVQTRTMTIFQWIDMAATLNVAGLEFYPGFLDSLDDEAYLSRVRDRLRELNLAMPMLCVSPDFTQPDPAARAAEVEKERRAIDLTAFFGGIACRVLSGQRRPDVSRAQGVAWVVESITGLLPHAAERGVLLTMENHYKDNWWRYPEFAQKLDVFKEIVDAIDSPHFGVNYDPSNAILAGDDPLDVLQAVKHRVVTMHASDRFLKGGTLDDLRKMEMDSVGYAQILSHGVVGEGLNDYDAIFRILKEVGFDGWISIEDGMNGMDEMRRSVEFLHAKIAQYFT
jgi:sugar phosphate isomerase/epimerase